MSLTRTITQDMQSAMKAKDSATLSTLRLLRSAMKNKQIDVQHELSDVEIQNVVKTQVKQLNDSIDAFESGRREDLVSKARAEIEVLERYLPAQLSDEELMNLLQDVMRTSGATSKADVGKVMGRAMAAVEGRADGSRVKAMVSSLLPVFVLTMVSFALMSQQAHAAIPVFETFASGPSYAVFVLRVVRVLMLWLGILAVTMILNGGFQYMVASARDDEHVSALTKMTHGIFASLIIAALFAFSTIALREIQ